MLIKKIIFQYYGHYLVIGTSYEVGDKDKTFFDNIQVFCQKNVKKRFLHLNIL